MDRYQLAKLVDWAGTLRSRKRMQKVVFLLQAAGCPLGAEYDLHHYGPYSEDVARLADELVREGLLSEQVEAHPYGEQYSYTLAELSKQQIAELEASAKGSEVARRLAPFAALARRVIDADLKELEVGSTIVFFRTQNHDWPAAIEKASQFKDLPMGSELLERAERLARQIVA